MNMTTDEFKGQVMLVKMERHQLSTSCTDKAVSAEVRARKGVSNKSGTWRKKLFAEGYESIRKIMSEVQKFHKAITVPYDDEGFAMLKAPLYEEYKERMDSFHAQLDSAVDAFCINLSTIIEKDRQALGETFCIDDYPSEEDVRERVRMEYKFQSLPSLDGVRINSFSLKELQEQNEKRLQEIMQNASQKPMEQLLDLVEKVKSTLGDPDKIFRNSLVANLSECLGNIEKLNLTNSPIVSQTATEAKQLLDTIGEDLDSLRKDKEFRSDVANKAGTTAERIRKVAAPKLKQ